MKRDAKSGRTSENTTKLWGKHTLGRTVFDAENGLLLRRGSEISLRAKSLSVLEALLARRGNVVSKADLIGITWPETHVTEDSLVKCIADIREALGDDATLLETYSKRGYRLREDEVIPKARRRWAVALAVSATLLAATIWLSARPGTDDPSRFGGRVAVLVMPFEDTGTGEDAGYLGDAISEGVIRNLSRFGEIAVIAAGAGTVLDANAADVAEMVETTGADFILRGSQRKQGERLSVSVRLMSATDGVTLWAESYERPIGELFNIQAELAASIAATVGYQLAYEAEPTADSARISALSYHIRGRNVLQTGFDSEINAEFARWNELAIEADPSASWGWSGLGWYYRNAAQHGWNGLDREVALERAVANAEQGLKLGPDDYYAHFVRAGIHATSGELEAAIRAYDRAIELNPSATNVLVLSTSPLLYLGRTDEAIARLRIAMEMDPFHPPWYFWQLAWALWQAGDCQEAEASIRRMPTITPPAQATLAVILECLGRMEEGREALEVYAAQRSEFTLTGERERLSDTWRSGDALERWIAALRALGADE